MSDERVERAAIRTFGGQIFSGASHLDAVVAAKEAGHGRDGELEFADEGFLTSSGRFVGRGEAQVIAAKAGQLADPGCLENTALGHHDLLPLASQPGFRGESR